MRDTRPLEVLDLAIIIPALNAAAVLPETLRALPSCAELLVVDGGSADATVAVAEELGARVIQAARGRGAQLRVGAASARSSWLLFLHADTRLDGSAGSAIADFQARSRDAAAAFRFRLEDGAWQARIIETVVEIRCRLFGLPYGDQGLLISRSLYEAVGGYRPLPLMEDVDLVRRLGRRRIRILAADARTSSERWRRNGWLAQSALNVRCLALFLRGASPEAIVQLYNRRRTGP